MGEKYLYYVCTYSKNGIYPPVCQTYIPRTESAPQRLAVSNRNQTLFPHVQDRSFPLFDSPWFFSNFLKILDKLRYRKMKIIKDGLRVFSAHTCSRRGLKKERSTPADGAPLLSKQLLYPMEYSQLWHKNMQASCQGNYGNMFPCLQTPFFRWFACLLPTHQNKNIMNKATKYKFNSDFLISNHHSSTNWNAFKIFIYGFHIHYFR